MLYNAIQKVKYFFIDNRTDIFIAAIIFLVGLSSFGLGRLSVLVQEKEKIRIEKSPAGLSQIKDINTKSLDKAVSQVSAVQGKYVASKSGTSYHLPWCPSATKIKEENKIWFNSKEEAEKLGYKPAVNCPGL